MFLVDSIQRLFLGAGAAWVLWLLLGLSLASLAIAIERGLFFRGRGGDLPALSAALERHLLRADVEGARAELVGSRALAAAVADAGLRVAHLGPAGVEKAMQGACAVERERLEARLAFLGTLGNNAPFVGLFGTVIGVIQAFAQLGVGAQGTAGQAVSQAVMAGIAEALIATAVGIGVALPAVAFYNYFQRRIARLLAGTEALTALVLAHLLAEDGGFEASVGNGSRSRARERENGGRGAELEVKMPSGRVA
jgi:biopolymer transport protein ExbB